MPIQTFWTNQGNNNVPVFQSTPGDSLPNPLGEIAGVNGTDVTALDQQSATLFPPPVATGPVPPGFNLPPTSLPVDEFEQWHSAYQIQYLQQHPYNTPPGSLAIGNAGTPSMSSSRPTSPRSISLIA